MKYETLGGAVRIGAAMLTISGVCTLAGCKGDKPQPEAAKPSATGSEPAAAPTTPIGMPTAASQGYAGPEAYDAVAIGRFEPPSGLIIEDLKIGSGDVVLPMSTITFAYRFRVKDGDEMYVSAEAPSDPPAEGATAAAPGPETQRVSRLMPGLRDGMVGMKAGGRRRITVPPHLAPGIAGNKNEAGEYRIAPDAMLIYVVDLIEAKIVAPAAAAPSAAPVTPAPN